MKPFGRSVAPSVPRLDDEALQIFAEPVRHSQAAAQKDQQDQIPERQAPSFSLSTTTHRPGIT